MVWTRAIKACLGEQGIAATCCTFSQAVSRTHAKTTPEQPLIIILQDSATWPSFAHLNPEQYSAFHDTLSAANNIMWIGENTPFSIGPVLGLACVLRKERHGLVFSTVALDPSSTPEAVSACIRQAANNFLQGVSTGACPEWELTQIGQPGLLDTLHFESLPTATTTFPHAVAIPINFVPHTTPSSAPRAFPPGRRSSSTLAPAAQDKQPSKLPAGSARQYSSLWGRKKKKR